MAAIASIDAKQSGPFTAALSTLTADDTITYVAGKKQLLTLRNPTGGSLTATLDGAGGSTITVPGYGSVSVAGGLAIVVPAGEVRSVVLGTVSAYCKGVVHLLGGAGLIAQIFDLS